jgi:hypothetical protein
MNTRIKIMRVLKGVVFKVVLVSSLFVATLVHAQSSIDVLIYDGPASSGVFLDRVIADQARPDVNQAFNIGGDHGFSWTVPSSVKNGQLRTLYVYGVNNNTQGANTLLSGSPMSIQCTLPPQACTDASANNFGGSLPCTYTPPQGPSVFITSNPSSVSWWFGGDVELLWSSSGASSCTASGDWSGAKATNGSQTVSISPFSNNKTYTLTCSNSVGSDSSSVNVTIGSSVAQCADGNDNDNDGKVDMADPGCSDASDTDETDTVTSQCSDGIDNDGDGFIDMADPNCTNSGDDNESAVPQCSDSIDNDNDGFVDMTDPGCANANDDTEDTDNPVCTVNCGTDGSDGSGGNNGGNGGNGGNFAGFTVSGSPRLAIQFLANLEATSQVASLSVNPVSGFSSPVTLSVESIRTATGDSLPAGVTPTYYFDGSPSSTVFMNYNASFGQYTNPSGTIGTSFAVKLSKKITEKYYITIIGTSGSQQSAFIIELNPNSVNPDFREI